MRTGDFRHVLLVSVDEFSIREEAAANEGKTEIDRNARPTIGVDAGERYD
jgi:hypothetical protein